MCIGDIRKGTSDRSGTVDTMCIQLVTGRGEVEGSISVVFIWADCQPHHAIRFFAGDLLSR